MWTSRESSDFVPFPAGHLVYGEESLTMSFIISSARDRKDQSVFVIQQENTKDGWSLRNTHLYT
jgi:hypothetical protein